MRASPVARDRSLWPERGGPSPARWRCPPEAHVAFVGFLLNYPWEMLQAPFFAGIAEMRHWDAVRECSWATVGDAALLVGGFWAGAVVQRSRAWMARPRPSAVAAFLAFGVLATVALEWLATNLWDRWQYAPRMPVVPGLGTGLAPLLQWLLLPPLLIWIVRRQLHGAAALASVAPSVPDEGGVKR